MFGEAEADPNAPYTPSPAKPFRNPPGFNKQGTGVGNRLAQQTRAELAKKKQPGVAEGVPQPGESSGAPKQFGPDAKIQTRQMTVKQIISSIPGLPYYNNVVDDWDAKDYSWGVTKKVIEYATYLKEHPESLSQLPPILVLNGKFEDGAHRVSAIWLLQQRMDPKNPLWANAKLNVQFVKQGVAEAQLDELSPETLKSYIKKSKGHSQKYDQLGNKADEKGDEELANKMWNKGDNRYAGDAQARNKLADLKDKKKGVAEGHADQQRRVFKKNGEPVGEVGIDRESSPGNGQWYIKHYASGKDLAGYDSYEEAVAELKHCMKQGVAEGYTPDTNYSYTIVGNGDESKAYDSKEEARDAVRKLGAGYKIKRKPRTSARSVKKHFSNRNIDEESSTSSEAVEIALIRRVLVAHTDLIMNFGLDKVTQAIEEIAYNVGDVDEIGTSDVSGWIHQVKQILGAE